MHITLHDTLYNELPVSITQYKTVQIKKAIIPMTYYNISSALHNNYMRYDLIESDTIVSLKPSSLVIPNGFYTPQSYNKALQKELKKVDLENAIEIIYLQDRGLIKIELNNKKFGAYFHKSLGEFLGLNYGPNYMSDTITGIKPPQFSPHHEYRISCNLVDKSKNLFKVKRSDIITSFVPKGEQYGDLCEYSSKKEVEMSDYDFTNISINILNHENKEIKFDSPCSIELTLK